MAKRKTNAVKQAAAAWPVPQSRAEADSYIARIGVAQRARTRIETQMNDRLAKIKESFEGQAAPLNAEIEGLAKGVQTWCAANRDELTRGGKRKTEKLAAGEISWRTRPPKVTIRGVAAVLNRLKAMGLARFIRTKEEIDKEAMLTEPDVAGGVEGVTVGSTGEDFVIKPFATELEEVV